MKKFNIKSILAMSAAVTMLFTGCGEKAADDDEKKEEKKTEKSVIDTDFDFEGFDQATSLAGNAMTTIDDAINGKLDTSVSTDITLSFGEALTSQLGYELGEFKLSNNASVKGDKVANDISVSYNDQTAITLNCVVDGETAYLRIPELNDAYIKGDVTQYLEDEMGVSTQAAELPEELTASLEAFDSEKLNEMLTTYFNILKDNMPEGEKADNISGSINNLTYDYTSKKFTVTIQFTAGLQSSRMIRM